MFCCQMFRVLLTKTVANRVLLKLPSQFQTKTICTLSLDTGSSQVFIIKDLPIKFDNDLSSPGQARNSSITAFNWIKKNGSLYKPGMVLCISTDDGAPQFSIIEYIFIHNDSVQFIVTDLNTVFNNHLYAYEVFNVCNICHIVNFTQLMSDRPLSVIKKQINNYTRSYVVFRPCL